MNNQKRYTNYYMSLSISELKLSNAPIRRKGKIELLEPKPADG